MNLAAATSNGEPDAKKFRFSMPTQVEDEKPNKLYDMNQNQGENSIKSEKSQRESAIESADSSFSSQNSPSNEFDDELSKDRIKSEHKIPPPKSPTNGDDLPDNLFKDPISAIFEQAASVFMKNFQQQENSSPVPNNLPKLAPQSPTMQSHQSIHAPIPGSMAIAASPAAQLFDKNDWSWHRNPAASIRSGGTNKQTPVWKYFVYNKVENLSRCIIGDCTYMLKGPHTSTLACHLKKHPNEYAEFQRLKMEYTRDRNLGTISNNGTMTGERSDRASSAASNGSSSSMNSASIGCNIKQGSSNGQLPMQNKNSSFSSNNQSLPRNNSSTPTMVNKRPLDHPQSPLSSIFAANPLLAANNITPNIARQPLANVMKNSGSMNELLNNLSARAAANFASQQNPATSSSNNQTSTNSPISTPSMTPTSEHQLVPPLHFMNLLKQNNGIFGSNNANFEQRSQQQPLIQQSKKWPRHERRQRELETKLALVMCSLQIPAHKLNDPFLRDFLETIQPKFQLLSNNEPMEQTLVQMYSRAMSNIKIALTNTSKFTLMVNVVKPLELSESNESGSVFLVISIAYYSQTQQRVETVLLGIKLMDLSEVATKTQSVVSQVLLSYELSMEQVTRSILDGFEEIGVQTDQLEFPNQLQSYRRRLIQSLSEIVDKSDLYIEIQEAVFRMVKRFCSYPEALMRLSRLCGMGIVASLQQSSFEKLAQTLLDIREQFLAVCLQQPSDQFVNIINDSQWAVLDKILHLKRFVKVHMEIVQENVYATIDRVVPSISQLLVTLEKDFPLLDDLPERLRKSIQQKLAFILDPNSKDFDASFVQATALNPQLVILLDENQLNSAKSFIEKGLCERNRINEESVNKKSGWKPNGLDSILAAVVERKTMASTTNPSSSPLKSSDDEQNSKSASSLYPDLVQAANQRRKQIKERNQNGKNHYMEAMLQAYFEDALNNTSFPTFFGNGVNVPSQPLQFWQASAMKCPQLSELAIELLSVPSSTIPPEFILNPPIEGGSSLVLDEYAIQHPFEFVREAKNLQTLERDAMTRFNRSFWQKSPFP